MYIGVHGRLCRRGGLNGAMASFKNMKIYIHTQEVEENGKPKPNSLCTARENQTSFPLHTNNT